MEVAYEAYIFLLWIAFVTVYGSEDPAKRAFEVLTVGKEGDIEVRMENFRQDVITKRYSTVSADKEPHEAAADRDAALATDCAKFQTSFNKYADSLTFTGDREFLANVAVCIVAYLAAFAQHAYAKDSWFPPVPTAIAGSMSAQIVKQVSDKFFGDSYKTLLSVTYATTMWFVSAFASEYQWHSPAFTYPAASTLTVLLLRNFLPTNIPTVPNAFEHLRNIKSEHHQFFRLLAVREGWEADDKYLGVRAALHLKSFANN